MAGQAEAAARSVTDPGSQARALVQVAGVLAEAGNIRTARQVAAAVCIAGEWITAARAVLPLNPAAFTMMARMLDDK